MLLGKPLLSILYIVAITMNSIMIKAKISVTLGWLIFVAISFSFSASISNSSPCHESERQSLLRFKQDLIDPSNLLASWSSHHDDGNCCAWFGVVCHNLSGHIIGLDLSAAFTYASLGGKLSDALLNLTHLHHLDLSFNNFGGSHIPEFLGSVKSLRYLNFSAAGFGGMIPHQLGNLSNLRYLDFKYGNQLHVKNLQWLSRLSMLQHLDMSSVNLSKVSNNWLQVTNSLSSLKYLDLSSCELDHIPLLSKVNFSSTILHLDLSWNHFQNSSIPRWFFGLSSLVFLNLAYTNSFQGPIPDGLRNMTSLRYLDLSYNFFDSSLPNWLYNFNHLETVILTNNNLCGPISNAIGNLTSLTQLYLDQNNFEGLASLGNLCKLQNIAFSNNKMGQDISQVLNILPRCVPNKIESLLFDNCQIFGPVPESLGLFTSLISLDLGNNKLNGTLPRSLGQLVNLQRLYVGHNSFSGPIPKTLRFLRSLYFLDMSNSGIRGTIPSLFWNLFNNFMYVNLSYNHFYGKLPDLSGNVFPNQFVTEFDLGSNHFEGPIPHFPFNLTFLDLSNNSFSGSISHFLCDKEDSSNDLQILRLGDNQLLGELPDQCWKNWPNLISLELQNNNLSGDLPSSIGTLSKLRSLHLRNNSLSGLLPSSLQSCTDLRALDVAENKFIGSIPKWIGKSFSNIMVLSLRSNKFQGSIPDELCALRWLKVLDLANNSLSGNIPKCFINYSAMTEGSNSTQLMQYSPSVYFFKHEVVERVILVMKGLVLEYSKTLRLLTIIDLSNNKLSGDIPIEITSLLALNALNLSRNCLTGNIPEGIGKMRSLESLDLSFNLFHGKIPSTMAKMTALEVLNLSYNNLSGEIPIGPQLQTFNAFDFIGNSLCGPPMSNCTTLNLTPGPNNFDDQNHRQGVNGFYVSSIVGFVVGFWGIVAPLLYSRSWRFKYFQWLQTMWYKICDAFAYH